MSEELAKCPECKEACKCEHVTVMGFNFWAVGHTNDNEGCPYSVQSDTKAQAIAYHERLAGKCRWLRREEPSENATRQISTWESECDEVANRMDLENYCPNCGKQIDEVKG